jgi:putative lipoic acid-binding regulatory protein
MATAVKLQLALVFILFAPSVPFSLDYCRPITTSSSSAKVLVSRIYGKLPEKKGLLKRNMSSSEENANIDRPIAGSFFNQVPSTTANDDNNSPNGSGAKNIVDPSLARIIDEKIPVAKVTGFGSKLPSSQGDNNNANILTALIKKKREQAQQRQENRLSKNDINNLQYDDKGYTLYSNEDTGEKTRVFDALVQYPCDFDIKIVGAKDGTFVMEMIQLVAASCKCCSFDAQVTHDSIFLKCHLLFPFVSLMFCYNQNQFQGEVTMDDIRWRERVNGKWTSITVTAPIKSSTMLYELYETIDRDSRVRFKF